MLIFLAVFSSLLATFYAYLMLGYRSTWKEIPLWGIPKSDQPNTSIDVIVPARNEAANISACILSICQNNYPVDQYRVWVVDDFSTDDTAAIVRTLQNTYPQLNLIQLQDCVAEKTVQSFKKQAIFQAIQQGQNDLIICTDADCLVPPDWLLHFASYYQQKGKQFIAAPVVFFQEQNLLERFQSLDFLGMMMITGAGIEQGWMHMSNGANLAYTRRIFNEVKGFQNIDHLASGDDMLLMQKIARHLPESIGFIKTPEVVVKTKAPATLKHFIQQRVRWASKSNHYPEWRITATLAAVFFFCWSILASFILIPLMPVFFIPLFLFLFLIKTIIDYYFLREATNFFQRRDLMIFFWSSQFLHILYISGIGLWANLQKNYVWKGRKVR